MEINKNKKKFLKTIFLTSRNHSRYKENQYKWGEVQELLKKENVELHPDDFLIIDYDEGYNDGDSSMEPHYSISVRRMVEESDDEFKRRIENGKFMKDLSRKRRYDNYLKLKEEFENE